MRKNDIKHIRCAPYHPSSNGAVERFVQTFKHAMKAGEDGRTLEHRLSSFLLSYRSTPNECARDPILESKFENSHGFG